MEKAIKRGILIFVVGLAAFVLFSTNLEGARASDLVNGQNNCQTVLSDNSTGSSPAEQTALSAKNQTGLSDFLLKLSEYLSNGNATELARIRKEMIQQERLNQAIDHVNPPRSPEGSRQTLDSYDTGYLMTNPNHSQPQYNYYKNPPELIGLVENWGAATGSAPDYDAAYYLAQGWYYNYTTQTYVWGEALTNGEASQPYNGLAEFHVTARSDHPQENPWHNYLIIEVSNTGDWNDWHYVHYVEVHSSDWQDYTIGSINIEFKYISIMVLCPPAWPLETSSLSVDNVYYIEYYRQVTLDITSGEGGTTNPSGQIVLWQYSDQPKVTAYPNDYYAFDHWEEDGIGIGGTNPIWIYMDDDHTLLAVFRPITDAWLYIEARDDYGNPLDANLYVDNEYVGTGSAALYLPVGVTYYLNADEYVYNPYMNEYNILVSGNGPLLLTQDILIIMHYTY